MGIKLGQEVRDRITGFKGIATVKMEFLNGCRRFAVQPKVDKKGEVPDDKSFDEPDLEIISSGILPEEKKAKPAEKRVHGDPSFSARRLGH